MDNMAHRKLFQRARFNPQVFVVKKGKQVSTKLVLESSKLPTFEGPNPLSFILKVKQSQQMMILLKEIMHKGM